MTQNIYTYTLIIPHVTTQSNSVHELGLYTILSVKEGFTCTITILIFYDSESIHKYQQFLFFVIKIVKTLVNCVTLTKQKRQRHSTRTVYKHAHARVIL